jgi:hypothetical protein
MGSAAFERAARSQYGPPSKCSFSPKNASKFAVLTTIANGFSPWLSKEIAVHETFSPFFRLKW